MALDFMSLDLKNIHLSAQEHILIVRIDRPEARNALDKQTWEELSRVVDFSRRQNQIQAVIITGGEKVFAAGADIKWLNKRPALEVLQFGGQDVLWELERLNKPVIAAIEGYALGGGCELAMACDIRIVSEKAKFGQPEVCLGLMPGAGGTQRLSRLVGYGRAKEMIITGEIIDAQEAYRIGLANKVVAVGETMAAALKMTEKILANGPVAVQLAKQSICLGVGTDMYTGMAIEKLSQTVLFFTPDREEGTSAFMEKRKAEFVKD